MGALRPPLRVQAAAWYRANPAVRDLAWRLKRPDPAALRTVANVLARAIDRPGLLVPVPDRRGDPSANAALCYAIAERTGLPVAALLTRFRVVPPSLESRLAGGGSVAPESHAIVLCSGGAAALARCRTIGLVDNVVVTGSTLRAAAQVLGRGQGLVWARDRWPV